MIMVMQTRGAPLPFLRQWRQRRFLTQAELADKAGVSRSTMARAEKGDTVVNFGNIRKLARALDITPDQLLGSPDGE